ncbi:RNA-guided endonuclease InsQ/TnpB family protein [Polycladomyces zharkentensis]|nr:transposase [Polycladomyces sp. WAk]
MRTYKFKLEPTKEQIEKMEWTLGMCRWLYNSMLEQRKFAYKRRGITLNYHKQAIELPELKKEIPEFKEIHSQVLQDVAKRLEKAFQAFFPRVKLGEKPGYPRFQGKNRYDSFTYLSSSRLQTGWKVPEALQNWRCENQTAPPD